MFWFVLKNMYIYLYSGNHFFFTFINKFFETYELELLYKLFLFNEKELNNTCTQLQFYMNKVFVPYSYYLL